MNFLYVINVCITYFRPMKHKLLLPLFFVLIYCQINAQNILAGPVVGAVKPNSVTMVVQLKQVDSVTIDLSPIHDFQIQTERRIHGFVAIFLSELKPYTRYEYTLTTGAESTSGSFRTFPQEGQRGTYTFVTGSCQETENMKVFDVMPKHDPMFMMHTGDYAYPDVRIGRDYAADYDKVALSYTQKYNEKRMDTMLRHVPIDYVFDDHDHINNGSGRYCSNDYNFERKGLTRTKNYMFADTFPYEWHANVVRGYAEFFPHYALPDTSEAIHHSFKMGNTEFFVLDRSSARRDPMDVVFERNKRGKYRFRPKPEHHLFGKKQMDWLKEGLKNSTADWKFIVSGVPLNRNIRKLIKAGVRMQNFSTKGFGGFHMASGYANYWAAYPHEMNDFYDFLEKENIWDVIVISGDTHHNVMDDGKNAGLPELNASGLSVEHTKLARYMQMIGRASFQFNYKKGVWNKGGNGLGNRNYKNGFGKILIEANEYVELSIVDEDNEVVSSFRVKHSSKK